MILLYDKFHVFKIHYDIVGSTKNYQQSKLSCFKTISKVLQLCSKLGSFTVPLLHFHRKKSVVIKICNKMVSSIKKKIHLFRSHLFFKKLLPPTSLLSRSSHTLLLTTFALPFLDKKRTKYV